MNQILASEMRPQPGSRNHSLERRGRSHTVRSQEHTGDQSTSTSKVVEYQFRPPEVVKNIPRIPNNRTTSFEKSRSRETSTARKERLNAVENQYHEKKRSTSVTSANYRNARAHSNLNPNVQNGNHRYRTPMSAYSTNEGVDTIVPNYSNMLYQKYQRPSIASRPSKESRISTQYQTPRSNVSVTMDSNDLVPAFNELTMELGEAMNDNIEHNKHEPIFEVDNKFADSNPQSLKSGSDSDNELGTFPEETVDSSLSEAIEEDKKVTQQQQPKAQEKFGRIQQRVNFLKQMKDEESNSSSKWKSMSIEQRMFFEYLNNDLRNLRRSNYKPLHDSFERTRRDNQVLDSSASVTSQYLLKTYNPLKEGRVYSTTPQQQQQYQQSKSKEVDYTKLKSLLTNGNKLAESMWETEEEHRPSQITLKSERGDKSSTDTAVSSINSDSMSVKLVTHTFEPKDLDAIKESFDGYELNSHNEPGNQQKSHITDSKHPSPLTQRY